MAEFITSPKENKYKSQILGELLESTTVPFILTVKKPVSFTLTGGDKQYAVLEPNTVNEEGVLISAVAEGGQDLTIEERGLPTYQGGPASTRSHGGGSTIIITDNWQTFEDIKDSINSKYNKTGGILTGPVQFDDVNVEIDRVGDDMVFKDVNQSPVTLSELAAAAGTDEKSKVSANDTTSGYLNGKLVSGTGIVLTENNDGGNETLTISTPFNADYGLASSGNDAYNPSATPAFTTYVDGSKGSFNPDVNNTGPATVNYNGVGAIPIKKGDYYDLETGDIFKNQQTYLQFNVKAVTFNAVLAMAATSGTLSANWPYKTGVYSVVFSNADRRDVTLTNGATSATWVAGLSAGATADAIYQYAQLLSYPASLVGGLNSSEQHYHDFVRNSSLARRNTYAMAGSANYYASTILGSDNLGTMVMATAASNNDWSGRTVVFSDKTAKLNANALSVHNKNPSFRITGSFDTSTNQEGFIGFIDLVSGTGWANNGTSLENSAMIINHVGFVVEDGTLYISCADGTTQTKTNISATVPSVTAGHIWEIYLTSALATFYVDNVSVGTLNTNLPTQKLNAFFSVVIASGANAKSLYMQKSGWIAHDEV